MWRKRLVALGGAVLGVAVAVGLAVWVVHNTEWRDESVPVPLKGEARSNAFYAAGKLVQALGGTTHSPQTLDVLPPVDAVLVLTSQHWDLFSERQEALRNWVQAGGRLVVPARLVDEDSALGPWLGVRRRFAQKKDQQKNDERAQAPMTDSDASQPQPSFDAQPPFDTQPPSDTPLATEPKVGSCADPHCRWYEGRERNEPGAVSSHISDTPDTPDTSDTSNTPPTDAVVYRVCGLYDPRDLERLNVSTPHSTPHPTTWSLERLHHAQTGPDVRALRIAVGQGSVTVITGEGLFTQRNLLKGDHARLLLALMPYRRGDAVWFVTHEQAHALLVLMWDRGAPVLVLCGLAGVLVVWRLARRFGPVMSEPPLARRSLVEQIRGTAEFLVRLKRTRVLWKAQWRALDEAAARKVQGWRDLTEMQRQQQLVRHCGLEAASLARARSLPVQASAHETAQALAILESARRRLLSTHSFIKE